MLASITGLVALFMAFEDKLIYFPSKYPDGFWDVSSLPTREGDVFPKIEDCYFETPDGLQLHGWYCTPCRKSAQSTQVLSSEMTLLWFHGNAGNLSYRYDMIRAFMALPVQVFIIDYRGYGKSEGKPGEQGLYLDARAAWDYLIRERKTLPRNIVIFGKSLGGAPAIDLASRVEPAGLIIQSSFTSAADVASYVLPFFPRMLLHTKMDSVRKIQRVGCPKLFIHSRSDEIIPFELGYRLYESSPGPKTFYEVKGASHNSTYLVGGKPYLDAIRQFIESCSRS